MKGRISDPVSVRMIARHVGYSEVWLKAIFKRVTGKGIWSHLLQMRLEKAKELLRETNLPISNVALQAGFGSHIHFSNTFRRNIGIAPTGFRHMSAAGVESGSLEHGLGLDKDHNAFFRDRFLGSSLGPWWKAAKGEWHQEYGCVVGKSEIDAQLRLTQALPENFHISLQARSGIGNEESSSNFILRLEDGQGGREYCKFILGGGNSPGVAVHRSMTISWNQRAILESSQWHRIEMELKDDTVRLLLDQNEMFSLRDPFPPIYADRCKLSIGTYGNAVHVREIEINDVGFFPLVQTVRQGDTLFNSGSHEAARNFYLRQLNSDRNGPNTMELQYKIGMTYLRQGMHDVARKWLEKIITVPERDFWAQEAQLALLRMSYYRDSFSVFLRNLQNLFNHPSLQSGVRRLSEEIGKEFTYCGFHEQILSMNQVLAEAEEPGTVPYFLSLERLAGSLFALNRFAVAEPVVRRIIQSPLANEEVILTNIRFLADLAMWQGKTNEAMAILDKIPLRTANQSILAHCEVYRAFGLRAFLELQKAAKLLEEIPARFPKAGTDLLAFSQLHRANILCMLGRPSIAKRAFIQAERAYPQSACFQAWMKDAYTYVVDLLEGKYSQAAEKLLTASRTKKDDMANAHQALLSGILFALDGKTAKAKRIWDEVSSCYPADQRVFYGPAAEALLSNEVDRIESIQYTDQYRTEVFFLVGLLCEKRKQEVRARRFFQLSSALDPTMRWPAYMAKKKLAGYSPSLTARVKKG